MERFKLKLTLLIAILSLLASCIKEKVETERIGWGVHYKGSPIHISSLLPDLEGNHVSSDGGVYSIVIPFPNLRYSYTPERIWLEPQDTSFSAQMAIFPSFSTFSPVSVPFHTSGNLSFRGLHKGEDIDLGYGAVSGTLTLHISYPESLPFDKIRLAANTHFKLPPFISVNNETCPEVRIYGDSGGANIVTTKEIVIPRTGYDFTFECTHLSLMSLPPLSGRFTCNGTIILSPEDMANPNNVEWEPSLKISLSTSTLEFTEVSGVIKKPLDNEFLSVKVPFPALSEQKLNYFNLAQVKTRVVTNGIYSSSIFCAQTGANIMETEPFFFASVSMDYFFSQALGGVEYSSHFDLSEYNRVSLEGLNDLVKSAPDSIGYSLQITEFPGYFKPGQEYYSDISTSFYIPLMFAGTYWGKTIQTKSITIPAKDLKEAYPGTAIMITGWVMNRQPFELKAVPVILDADGVSHRFVDDAITVEGSRFFTSTNGQKDFYIRWPAETTSRPISIYLEMTLGTGSFEIMAPDQDIVYGIKMISKEVEIKQ